MFEVGHKKYGGRQLGTGNKLGREFVDMFIDSLSKVDLQEETTLGKKLIDHIICRAFENDTVALGVLRKLIPDLSFSIEKLIGEEPVSVTFDIVDTTHTLVNKNRANILGILKRVKDGELGVEEGFTRLGEEMLN